jgi:hypothetical protein
MRQDPGPLPFLQEALTIAKFEPGMYVIVQTFWPAGERSHGSSLGAATPRPDHIGNFTVVLPISKSQLPSVRGVNVSMDFGKAVPFFHLRSADRRRDV